MTTQVRNSHSALPPLPPVRRNWIKQLRVGPLLVAALIVVFMCYPASLIARGLVGAAYMKQGSDALQSGRLAEARANFNRAMDWSLDNEAPFDGRRTVAHQSNDLEAAVSDYSAVISSHPDRPLAYCYRGQAYRELDRDEEALHDYRACLAREPGSTWSQVAKIGIQQLSNVE